MADCGWRHPCPARGGGKHRVPAERARTAGHCAAAHELAERGRLREDGVAADPRIDELRKKITCVEDKGFTRDYHDPGKRSIANALKVELKDGGKLGEFVCEYPIGHKRRRGEGMPVLVEKFKLNLARRFPAKQQKAILDLCMDAGRLEKTPVHEFVDLFVI